MDFPSSRRALSRRRFLKFSLALAATGLGVGFYSWQVEPTWLELVSRPLPVQGLPAALDGARLVHFSDIHLGPRVADEYLLDTFRRVAALQPDIVVVTGDFTSDHGDVIDHTKRIYSHFPHGRLATVGTLGNHDYGRRWADLGHAAQLTATLGALGVQVLRNEVMDVAGLQIVGMDDLWARRFQPSQALAAVNTRGPMLALSHNPDTVDRPGWERFTGWILAGHTHGGQVKPPFLPPPMLPVQNRRYTAGEFELSGSRRLYISRGVGYILQVRFNVRPEVTVFELQKV